MYIIWQIFNYMKYRIDITPLPNCREISTMKVYESVMMPCREHPSLWQHVHDGCFLFLLI